MGQTCSDSVFSCRDCSVISGQEIISEPSIHVDALASLHLLNDNRKDPILKCIEKIDEPIFMYEDQIQETRLEMQQHRKSMGLDESNRLSLSPKLKMMSSNASEKAINLLDKLSRTSDTDKSFSSNSHN